MKNCPKCHLALAFDALRCPRCGSDLSEPIAPLLVDGRYAVEGEIGHGAMGFVYRARDTGLDRPVALKFIAPQFVRDAKNVERFRREAAALAAVRNEHVVQVFAFGRHDDTIFFAMEYVRGQSLEKIIASHTEHNTTVPLNLALTILARVSHGLAAVHSAGLIHRDVKPGNVVIEDGTGRPVLLDFGLVKPMAAGDPRQTEVVGSPPYMAPEQILPARAPNGLTAATDVYSLGCTAFELLTGTLPFAGESVYETMHLHLTAAAPPLSAFRPELRDLDPVLARALAKEPSARHESAEAFAADVERARKRRGSGASVALARTLSPSEHEGSVRILIIDDDPLMRKVLARAAQLALPSAKLLIVHAETGLDALHRMVDNPPNLILIDYDMPGMNGVETLALMRSQRGVEKTPAIVTTGHDTADLRWRFSVLGVTEYLTKPPDLEKLTQAIRRSLP